MAAVGAVDLEPEPSFLAGDTQAIRAAIAVGMLALRREVIVLDQVEDRDAAFLFDIGRAPSDAVAVEFDVDDRGSAMPLLLEPMRRVDK